MSRILTDFPDESIKWLNQLAAEQGKSRVPEIARKEEGGEEVILLLA